MRLALFVLLFITAAALPGHALAESPCAPAQLSSITINETTDQFEINAEYPVLCSPVATRFIRDFATFAIAEFKADPPVRDMRGWDVKYQYDIGYTLTAPQNRRFVSVGFQFYAFTGGAHGNNWPTTWTFDLVNGTTLSFDDIFQSGTLKALPPLVRPSLINQLEDMYVEGMLESGIKPDAHNYANFLLTEQGVRFLFATYQVAPYVAGQQEVTLSWDTLAPYLTGSFRQRMQ